MNNSSGAVSSVPNFQHIAIIIFENKGFETVIAQPGIHVHLYGKKVTKPFRKMGHVTIVDSDIPALKRKADFVKQTLKVKA